MAHCAKRSNHPLPVDAILPQITASLAANRHVVLQAPPGSGKTTRVAPYLLHAPWLQDRKILMLEPRRLAARSAAAYMAASLNQRIGETIGYHIRLDRQVSPATRIEILTEGLLTQRLLSDPELHDTAAIIFDEFHERSLAADTGLALALESRQVLRPDLRLIIMSATLFPHPIAQHLTTCDIHTADTTSYPVTTIYLDRDPTTPLHLALTNSILRALQETTGSILAFLPGEGEIRRTLTHLQTSPLPPNLTLHPLYSLLTRQEQDAAIAPAPPNQRKVVLATSIAESSLTIQGISTVIDCGWMRLPRFSPATGMSRLETLRITHDRADQRRGRAGRLGPGTCYRLWSLTTDQQLTPQSLPEILDADLAPTLLQCAEWGAPSRLALPWLTPPPDAAWRHATTLLQNLGALTTPDSPTDHPTITPRGRSMARLPIHPRLSHMLIHAAKLGAPRQAALLAATLSEAPSTAKLRHTPDLQTLLSLVSTHKNTAAIQRIHELARRWSHPYPSQDSTTLSPGYLLALAYPDRIARRRGPLGTYLLRTGRAAQLDPAEPLAHHEWLATAELHETPSASIIRLAAPITPHEINQLFESNYQNCAEIFWDRRTATVIARNRLTLGAITIRESDLPHPDPTAITTALLEGIRHKGLNQLPWTKAARHLQTRVTFLHHTLPDQGWPDLSDATLTADLEKWLPPFIPQATRWSHLMQLDLHQILTTYLDTLGTPRHLLDKLAPTRLPLPCGTTAQIHYDQDQPYLQARVQELFGLHTNPTIANNTTPLTIHLLSPARRPVQITSDIASFWHQGYPIIRKELRGRYPKHHWPEDPLSPTQKRANLR